jgi:hypothetical protein
MFFGVATVSNQDNVLNYPDLLGAITGGPRLNVDVIQCAVAVRPSPVPAGQIFDLILLIQNASDIDVDIVVKPVLPEYDANRQKGRFTPKSARLRIGVLPAEVGYVTLSVATSPSLQPSADYLAGVSLEIERMEKKKPQRVRVVVGGGMFAFEELPEVARTQIQLLRPLSFSADPAKKKNFLQTPLVVGNPGLTSLKAFKEQRTEWISLWTMRDHVDAYIIAQRVWPQAQEALQKLKRENVFMPLLKANQEHFQACQYTLMPPEAISITKLMTLMLEMGAAEPTPGDPHPNWPRWFTRLCRLLFQEPALATQPENLATRLLYPDLVYDAVLHGFTMVAAIANENFGSTEETGRYADNVVDSLMHQKPLNFANTYFPLVMGGLIANARVTMPREQVRETAFVLSKALEKRRPEKDQDNTFIFEIADKLIERALDTA